ncbi:Crp/Fnr family transcriptional regulator [Aequorivita sp. SDUM287046]|uniref:Crp/Fnr family transcriptional regulator n=1 Tax=Aequorivita aurantiaca TaxID=3053356 RepID=A0ABT8DE74_9FLAO|nr:Crp/Fnr family transcriptional regulator [Aequorivita aurantiaca]MDN3723586.1 Crp/Fnr family transcriptional regulator [Aequorivita aurantiaca]
MQKIPIHSSEEKIQNHSGFKAYLTETVGIAEADAELLTSQLQHKNFKKGDILLREGDICKHSFFVQKGLLRSYMLDEDGKEHVIQFAPENWFIVDRSSVYFNDPSESYIEAIEDSETVFIAEDFMCHAAAVSPVFGKFNDKLLHNHIRQMQKRINLLLGATAEKRYLSFIEMYPDLLLRVPQWMIASYLGITPESLSRVRKELAQKNFKTN